MDKRRTFPQDTHPTIRRIQHFVLKELEVHPSPSSQRVPPLRPTPKIERLAPAQSRKLARIGPTAEDLAGLSVFGGAPTSPEEMLFKEELFRMGHQPLLEAITALPPELQTAARLMLDGWSDRKIARRFNISTVEFRTWKKVIENSIVARVQEKLATVH